MTTTFRGPTSLKHIGYKFILVLLSLIFCFAIIETSLRIFYPKYEYAADANFDTNNYRIWARKKNSHSVRKHPDTGQPHVVYYDNLALRQDRNFDENDINSAVNIAFFGDSFTENVRLPSQYSFTEPLDYLLNLSPSKFNVLNLGVDGYGPDQSFLYYRDFRYSKNLDYVFYVFCVNDVRNIYENNLFSLSETKELIQNRYVSPWWVNIINKFHTTYLVMDSVQRLKSIMGKENINDFDPELWKLLNRRQRAKRFHDYRADSIQNDFVSGRTSKDLQTNIDILESLLHLWKEEVEKNGGKFYVVLLPRHEEHDAKPLFIEEFNVLDLFEKFDNTVDNYDFLDWRFKRDVHWNEAGNLLATIHLYRFLEKELNLSPLSDDALKEQLYTYYSSFDGWMPGDMFTRYVFVSPEKKESIRSKYNNAEIIP
jgi:hypothetical protein